MLDSQGPFQHSCEHWLHKWRISRVADSSWEVWSGIQHLWVITHAGICLLVTFMTLRHPCFCRQSLSDNLIHAPVMNSQIFNGRLGLLTVPYLWLTEVYLFLLRKNCTTISILQVSKFSAKSLSKNYADSQLIMLYLLPTFGPWVSMPPQSQSP